MQALDENEVLLYCGNTHDSAFLFKKSGVDSPSPVIYISGNKEILYVPLFEYEYFRKYAGMEIRPMTDLPHYNGNLAVSLAELLKNKTKVLIPASFPAWLFQALKASLVRLEISDWRFVYPTAIKSNKEIRLIRENAMIAKGCFGFIKNILAKTAVRQDKILYYKNVPLSAHHLGHFIRTFLAEHHMASDWVSIAGGKFGFYPHCAIDHPLKAAEPIIIDIAYKNFTKGYYIDSTRTFCKGAPDRKFVDLYEKIFEAKNKIERRIVPGSKISDVAEAGENILREAGVIMAKSASDFEGALPMMHHSLGHGIGRDLHELPAINSRAFVNFEEGMAIAVEPGGYIKGSGGIRIEDTCVVTGSGCDNITAGNYDFIVE